MTLANIGTTTDSIAIPDRRRRKPKENDAGTFFRQVYKTMKGGNRDEFEKLKLDLENGDFFEDSRVTQKNSKGETFLSVIVDETIREEDESAELLDVTELLVSELIKRYPDVLLQVDSRRETPLRSAIQNNDEWLVGCICSACDNLSAVLKQFDDAQANCLHAAVRSDLPNDIVLMLIERSTKEILAAQETIGGCTPLHLAVEYERCGEEQLEIVQKLVACNDGALDVESWVPQRCSVYRYHEHSRKTYQQSFRDEKQQQQKQPLSELANLNLNDASDGPEEHKPQKPPPPRAVPAGELPHKKSMAGVGPSKLGGEPKHETAIEELDKKEASANAIRDFIKMHYLRSANRDAERTATWLYGDNIAGEHAGSMCSDRC